MSSNKTMFYSPEDFIEELEMMEQPGWVDLYQANEPTGYQGHNPTEHQGDDPAIIEERSTCWAGLWRHIRNIFCCGAALVGKENGE